jgi:pimeloyl-ACP methyl ester carboxylesterase
MPQRQGSITRAYVRTARGQIHRWECGAGPALVLLAPAPRSARVYRHLLPWLGGELRALALDTRGFGESDPPDTNPTMADYAEDVIHVLDALAIETAHVFGLHTGNKIAAAVAAGWPDRTSRLVLVGRTHSIIADQAARNAAVRASMTASPTRAAPVAAMPDPAGLDGEALQALQDERIDEAAGWAGVDAVYRANFEFDLAECLSRVKAPTLIVEMVTDETALLGRQGPLLQALMSNGECLVIEEHERTLLRDHPARLAEPVLAFLKA